MKQQLKRTFSNSGINSPAIKDEIIKPEDTYMTTECTCSARFNQNDPFFATEEN